MVQGKALPKSLAKALIDEGLVENHFLGGAAGLSAVGGLAGGLVGRGMGSFMNPLIEGLGLNNNFNAFYNGLMPQDLVGRVNQSQARQTEIYNQQQNLAQALLAQSQGLGPNPAAAMLAQQTGNNVQQQAALMASMRGASTNPALVARLAAQQGAGVQQNAVGQAATLQAQQQLAAQQALQQQQSQMANQAITGEQTQLNYLTGGTSTNADIAKGNQQTRNQLIGGAMNAGGAAMGMMNDGGVVEGPEHVKGDSEKNDVVPALLSAGEIVIPKSIVQSKNAPEKAKAFVEKLLEERGGFEGVVKAKKSLKERVEHLEKLACGGMVKKKDSEVRKYNQGAFVEPIDWEDAKKWDPNEKKQELSPLESVTPESIGQSWVGDLRAALAPKPTSVFETMPTILDSETQAPMLNQAPPEPMAPVGLTQTGISQPQPSQGFSSSGELSKIEGAYAQSMERQAKAEQEQQRALSDLYSKHSEQQIEAQNKFNQRIVELNDQQDALAKDIMNHKIDPDRYWSNKGTGSKVSTIIGVMLSGIGQGLQGPGAENMAWGALQKNIERDIQAQRDELGKKQTMLSDNLRIYGNITQAEQATRLQSAAILEGQIARIAAQSNDPLVQERAKQAVLNLRLQTLPLKQQFAQEAQRKEMVQRASTGENPEFAVSVLVPEKHQSKAFEEIQTVNMYKNTAAEVKKLFNEAKKLNAATSSLPFSQQTARRKAIKAQLVGAIRETMRGTGQISDKETELMVVPLVNEPLDTDSQLDEKLTGVLSQVGGKMRAGTPILKAYGINMDINPPKRLQMGPLK